MIMMGPRSGLGPLLTKMANCPPINGADLPDQYNDYGGLRVPYTGRSELKDGRPGQDLGPWRG